MNTEQECKLKNNVKEQAERIKLLKFSTGVYLSILTEQTVRWTVVTKPLKEQLCLMRESHSASRI